jgi:hypothetical protein
MQRETGETVTADWYCHSIRFKKSKIWKAIFILECLTPLHLTIMKVADCVWWDASKVFC